MPVVELVPNLVTHQGHFSKKKIIIDSSNMKIVVSCLGDGHHRHRKAQTEVECMICMMKSNGSAGCGALMIPGRHYAHTDFKTQEAEEAYFSVSFNCPICGNHVDSTIEANRRTQSQSRMSVVAEISTGSAGEDVAQAAA